MAQVTAEMGQTATVEARVTRTAQAQGTATSAAAGTATADAAAQETATQAAASTGTAQARASATGAAQRTATAMAAAAMATRDAQVAEANQSATATAMYEEMVLAPIETATAGARQTREAEVAAMEANMRLVFGPRDGNMVHDASNWPKFYYCGILATNVMAEVTFTNPYAASQGAWDYGLVFRYGPGGYLGLSFFSDKVWAFYERVGDETDVIVDGELKNLNVGAGESNHIKLFVNGEEGLLYVNDTFVSRLDLSPRTVSGDVIAVSGAWIGDEIAGEVTAYEDFTVFVLQ
jgi:hypothetical protein